MRHEDVSNGMLVKYWDFEYKMMQVAKVLGTDEYVDEYGNDVKQVLLDDPVINGRIISIGAGHLEPYKEFIPRDRVTHCWGDKCIGLLNSKTMSKCDKCNGIICPNCSGCLCGFNKS